MALDPSIILSGRSPSIVNALGVGAQAGQQMREYQSANALRDLYATSGPDILAGNPAGLNALARISPEAALGVQGSRQQMEARDLDMSATRQGMAQAERKMGILEAQERRDIADHAAKLSAPERAAQAAQIEDAVKMGLLIQSPDEWDRIMAAQEPSLVGQFGNRQALAARYMSVAEILKQNAPPAPMSAPGKIQADINAGILPAGTPLRGPGTTINNNMGGGKFDEVFASEDAKALAGVSAAAMEAQSNLGRINRLSSIMVNSPSGSEAAFKSMLGDYGIATEGLDNLQAAEALINAMVPGQRPPGSGTMSDRDVDLFKKSLPRLINTPGGNAKILSTLRGIAEYDIQRGSIVQALRAGQIDRAQAFSALQSLPNPLSGPMAGDVDGGYRFRGGDPSDRANWEQVK